jgi:endonuclease-3
VTGLLERAYGVPEEERDDNVLDSLIGCILSQNTTDTNSDRAWRTLKARFPTWAAAARAPRRSIEAAIRVAGLGLSRSRRIKEILSYLKRTRGRYDLEFLREAGDDETFRYLSSLKGVGKKTAAVVLLFALGRDVFPVDTHVQVICQRLGLVPEDASRDEVYEEMKALVPRGKALSLHLNLIRFGKERCRKRNPLHKGCPLRRECVYVKAHSGE